MQYGLPGSPDQFQLTLTDNTNGQSYTTLQTSSASSPALRTSAEWVVEAPTPLSGSPRFLPLPTFGSVTFTDAQATIGSTSGAIDDPAWQATEINMEDDNSPKWIDAMNASALTTTGTGDSASSSFTVTQTPEPSTFACLARRRRHWFFVDSQPGSAGIKAYAGFSGRPSRITMLCLAWKIGMPSARRLAYGLSI